MEQQQQQMILKKMCPSQSVIVKNDVMKNVKINVLEQNINVLGCQI